VNTSSESKIRQENTHPSATTTEVTPVLSFNMLHHEDPHLTPTTKRKLQRACIQSLRTKPLKGYFWRTVKEKVLMALNKQFTYKSAADLQTNLAEKRW